MPCPCRNITGYIGVGGHLDGSLHDSEQARKVLNSTFLVQEFIDGGNLRKQVLQQANICPSGQQS